MALAILETPIRRKHYHIDFGDAFPSGVDLTVGSTLFEVVVAGPPPTGNWYIYTEAGWVAESLPAIAATFSGDLPDTAAGDLAAMRAAVEGATPAGEVHIGEVGGNTVLASITPVVTAGAYTANDIVGGTGAGAGLGINTLANAVRVSGGTGIIQSLVISDLAAQNAVFEIYLFSANPAAGTYTDNAALDIHDTDALLCIGRIDVSASDYKSLADNSIACVRSIGLPIKVAATSLFVIIRTTGTPTYVGTSDLKLTFGILRD